MDKISDSEEADETQSNSDARSEARLSMTLSDLRDRNNLFLTEIGKGLRTEGISALESIDKSQQRTAGVEKNEDEDEESEESEEEQSASASKEKPTRNSLKNPINSAISRNILAVSGPYY